MPVSAKDACEVLIWLENQAGGIRHWRQVTSGQPDALDSLMEAATEAGFGSESSNADQKYVALEVLLEKALERLAAPNRDSARLLFGLDLPGVYTKVEGRSKTRRRTLAAGALGGQSLRTFLRPKDDEPSKRDQIIRVTAEAVIAVLTGQDWPEEPDSQKGDNRNLVSLTDRTSHAEQAISLLAKQPQTFRCTYVGPLFLHPDWYFERRNADTHRPHIDSALFDCLRQTGFARRHDIRLILRNSPRYRAKVDRYVDSSERSRLIEDVLATITLVWGKHGEQGPDLCCVDSGFIRVELIFDHAMIVSHRAGPLAPLTSGTLITDPEEIDTERAQFDAIFDGSSRGQYRELSSLRAFVEHLWD